MLLLFRTDQTPPEDHESRFQIMKDCRLEVEDNGACADL